MIVKVQLSSICQTKPYEYVIRFVLGGLTTVIAGLVADTFGPATGGLFVAFPALFCASATLVEKHERERKERKGLKGEERARGAAALDAVGAGWGSLALAAFAAVVFFMAFQGASTALSVATMVWLAGAAGLWLFRRKARRARFAPENSQS